MNTGEIRYEKDEAGQNEFAAVDGLSLTINDGYVYVEGDVLDSNGDMYVTGEKTIVNGPTNSGNDPLDYNGEFVMTGE